jgi:hypothetical protein
LRGFAAAGLKASLGQANVLLRSYFLGRGAFSLSYFEPMWFKLPVGQFP